MTLPEIHSTLRRPLAPQPTHFSRPFWRALEEGRLTTTRCGCCDALTFPPREHCPHCGKSGSKWIELSGKGKLYSRTRIHAAGGAFAAFAPYSVGIVDLDEGLRIIARVMPDASALPLDSPVQVAVVRHTDGVLFAVQAAR